MEKKKTVLVVAPHPDDETLGCGGALLRHAAAGDAVHWLIVTAMGGGYPAAVKQKRKREIAQVVKAYPFTAVHELGLPAAKLDSVGLDAIIARMSPVFKQAAPHTVYLPFPGDAHSDHRASFEAAAACTKWFRYPSLKRALCYETLSETDFGVRPHDEAFKPNVFVDIGRHLQKKLAILQTYAGELGEFPFPRSEQAVRALAKVRGAAAGVDAAEAFVLLKEIA